MSSSPMCFLIANDDDQKTSQLIPRISIPTNFIDIGRSPITNIRDPCCSRNQSMYQNKMLLLNSIPSTSFQLDFIRH